MGKKSDDIVTTMKKCYGTIIVLAGDDKKEFLDKEVSEVEEKASILTKAKERLDKLYEYNASLTKTVDHAVELKGWAVPVNEKLTHITTPRHEPRGACEGSPHPAGTVHPQVPR